LRTHWLDLEKPSGLMVVDTMGGFQLSVSTDVERSNYEWIRDNQAEKWDHSAIPESHEDMFVVSGKPVTVRHVAISPVP
jgi:hypothetical protein